MDEIFKVRAGVASLPLLEEQALILAAQAGDGDAVWALLVQYRGLLQKTAWAVRRAVRGMSPTQIEDMEADLILTAVEAIKAFDLTRWMRLSQVLPGRLKDVAGKRATALAVPRGTLALWFKIWNAAEQDAAAAEQWAPELGMSADTFRAIAYALTHADSEWTNVPFTAGGPTPDTETARLAEVALATLTPAERAVIELVFGFRGEPKTDEETALILDSTRGTVKTQRQRALIKMRAALAEAPKDPRS